MKTTSSLFLFLFFIPFLHAQKVTFEEFDLENGLHVILHQDKTAPLVVTSVLYHVGSKDEKADRTGFAHFFEHLLFEATENIERGTWFKKVTANGGKKKDYEIKFSESQTHFYDMETHLKIQTLQTIEIMGNVQTSTIKYEDYKSVDGIYFPHKTTVSAGPQEIDFITQTIELNSTLEESLFK